ncbi:MAG TPA: glycosyltransferase family 4 protein [Bryobacteraceae bacterium]|nr:glycosyltransferase family 4 protein [Bryobacteraceae bacterium]
MKTLIVITRAELGGGQTHVADLLRGLRDEFDVELATGETGYLTDVADEYGIRWHVLPDLVQPMRPWQDVRALSQCVRLIRTTRPDLVHTHTSKAGTIGRLAARICGVPSIFTAHTWCFAEGTSWKWKLAGIPIERLAARCASRIITVSRSNEELAIRKQIAPDGKFTTIHNGIADTIQRARPGSGTVPRIVMVARFSEQKAQNLLVEAVRTIQQPFELLLIGEGPTRAAVERQVAEAGIGDRVQFLGQRLDVPEILASSHIFALFTNWEGFPISILEAMRAGLPVVASNVNGVKEAVKDGYNGFLIPAGGVGSFRTRLEQLIADAGLRAEMGRAARHRFVAEFTVDAMLSKTAALYRSVLPRTVEAPALALSTSTKP